MGGQGTANGGKGHGAGTAGGNAKEDEHGKQNSNIPSEDLQIIRTEWMRIQNKQNKYKST